MINSNSPRETSTQFRARLTPQIAEYRCLYENDIPSEQARLEKLSDADFRHAALDYLIYAESVAEQALMDLRLTRAIIDTPGSPPLPINVKIGLKSACDCLTEEIRSDSNGARKAAGILWSLRADNHKISLRSALAGMDSNLLSAFVSILSAHAIQSLDSRSFPARFRAIGVARFSFRSRPSCAGFDLGPIGWLRVEC